MKSANKFEYVVFGFLLLLIFIISLPYGGVEIWWTSFFVTSVYLIFIIRTIYDSFKSQMRWVSKTLFLPLVLLAFFAYLQSLLLLPVTGGYRALSTDPTGSWFFACVLSALIIFTELILRSTLDQRMLKILIQTVIAIAVGSAIFGIIRQLFLSELIGSVFPPLTVGQGFGQLINRNHFALLMILALGLVLGLAFKPDEKPQKFFYLSLAAVLITGLTMTVSRGGVIALVIQLTGWVLLRINNRNNTDIHSRKEKQLKFIKQTAGGFLLLLVALIGIAWIGDEKLVLRIEEGFREKNVHTEQAEKITNRTNFWTASVALAAENPIVGIGFGGYKFAITRHFKGAGLLRLEQAHNDYLEFFVDGGLVGVIFGIWFLILLIRKIRKNFATVTSEMRPIYHGAISSLIGAAVQSAGDFGLQTLINSVIFFIIIIVLSGNFAEEGKSKYS